MHPFEAAGGSHKPSRDVSQSHVIACCDLEADMAGAVVIAWDVPGGMCQQHVIPNFLLGLTEAYPPTRHPGRLEGILRSLCRPCELCKVFGRVFNI